MSYLSGSPAAPDLYPLPRPGERIGPNGESTARHEYFEEFQRRRMDALAQGKDPYAEFKKDAKAASEDQPLPRLLKRLGLAKLFGIGGPEAKNKVVR